MDPSFLDLSELVLVMCPQKARGIIGFKKCRCSILSSHSGNMKPLVTETHGQEDGKLSMVCLSMRLFAPCAWMLSKSAFVCHIALRCYRPENCVMSAPTSKLLRRKLVGTVRSPCIFSARQRKPQDLAIVTAKSVIWQTLIHRVTVSYSCHRPCFASGENFPFSCFPVNPSAC